MSVKGDLRRAFRQRRRDKINRAAADAAIARRVLDSSAYGQARVLLGYAALPEEIQTDGILRRALAEGKALYLPRCLDDAGQMAFYRVQALEDLESGSFGVREPSLAAPQYNMDLDGQALCLVPGLCFDNKGYRLGYGKGYYDRFLAKFRGVTLGLCYNDFLQDCLPVGDYDKPAIRESARQAGLLNADKADSQDICFVPDGDYTAFLQEYGHVTLEPGNFVDREGRVLGRHKGLPCYTTGQRKGLGVSAGKHVYVVRKNARDNTILLGDDRDLFTSRLTACRVNWIAGAAPADTIRVTAKTRYSQTEAEAAVTPLPDGRMEVVFDRPQRAVTAGQAVVLYDGDEVLGGGTIESAC